MRHRRNAPFVATAAALAAAVALGGCGTDEPSTGDAGGQGAGESSPRVAQSGGAAPSTADEPNRTYEHYVALGDSFAAVGGRDAGFSGPEFCQRSGDNYPALLLASNRIAGGEDVTCQGAQIPHLTGPRQTYSSDASSAQIPAQLDSLTADTDLVTLSIGGNDIDFGTIVGCYGRSMLTQVASQCGAELDTRSGAALDQLESDLDAVYEQIADRAPDARVIVTGYVPLISAGDDCTQIGAISPEDREWAFDITEELNDVIGDAARRHGAEFVLPGDAEDHTACAETSARWVDFSGEETHSFPMHPTPAGHAAVAAAVEASL